MLSHPQSLSFAGVLHAGDLAAPPPAARPASARPPRADAFPLIPTPDRRFAEIKFDAETKLDEVPDEHWDAVFADAGETAPQRLERRLRDDRAEAAVDPARLAEAERWFFDQIDIIDADAFDTLDSLGPDGVIRRWEAAMAAESAAEPVREVESPGARRAVDRNAHDTGGLGIVDPFPTPGGEAFRSLGVREWAATLPPDDDVPTVGALVFVAFLSGVGGLLTGFGLGVAFAELVRRVLA